MPELPEVETVRLGLIDRLDNFYISHVEICKERTISSIGGGKLFAKKLEGLFVGNWSRRGKYLLASLHQEKTSTKEPVSSFGSGFWGVHLRMTGYFQWHDNPCDPCPHTRARFWSKNGEELRFVDVRNFGEMWWVPPNTSPEKIIHGLKRLGPEPFSKAFNASYLKKSFKGSTRSIKAALLDQSLVAGIGNIYSDESLFLAGIRPRTLAGNLNYTQLEILCKSIVEVLYTSIGVGGTTFSDFRDLKGKDGKYGGEAWVYRRSSQPCRRCGTPIQKEKIVGRSSHWCPICQT